MRLSDVNLINPLIINGPRFGILKRGKNKVSVKDEGYTGWANQYLADTFEPVVEDIVAKFNNTGAFGARNYILSPVIKWNEAHRDHLPGYQFTFRLPAFVNNPKQPDQQLELPLVYRHTMLYTDEALKNPCAKNPRHIVDVLTSWIEEAFEHNEDVQANPQAFATEQDEPLATMAEYYKWPMTLEDMVEDQ